MFTDFPCAKINLGLNIVNRRADGYHDLETVFYPVGICDEIRMEACSEAETNGEACRFVVEGLDIEGDINDNLVVKACRMVKEKHKEMPAVKIVLKKQGNNARFYDMKIILLISTVLIGAIIGVTMLYNNSIARWCVIGFVIILAFLMRKKIIGFVTELKDKTKEVALII